MPLIKKTQRNSTKKQTKKRSVTNVNDEKFYEIRRVKDMKFESQRLIVCVEWKIDGSTTWESLDMFSGGLLNPCIQEFIKQNTVRYREVMISCVRITPKPEVKRHQRIDMNNNSTTVADMTHSENNIN